MHAFGVHRLGRGALALALSAVLACAAAPAFAAPSAAQIEAKKAEEAQAREQIKQLQIDMATKVSEYLEVSREMQRTREDIASVTAQIAQLDSTLLQKENAFTKRAIQLYRGDQTGMLEILLTAESVKDLFARAYYLVLLGQRDTQLITEVRQARNESLYLQESLAERIERLTILQSDADAQRSRIESDMALAQATAEKIGADVAAMMRGDAAFAGSTPNGEFNPDTVISEAQFWDYDAMSVDDIQAFLEQQPGTLATYRAKNHAGEEKSTAEMIAEAAAVHGINPKVILVKLQKEQSLLADSSPTQRQYDWAMGCGKADSRTYYQYQGFGKQIYWGAQKLKKNAGPWRAGIKMTIDGSPVYPSNSATYSLYKYTPHLRGTTSFWLLYWRYFGDPLA